jgi:hypothetical protein
MCGKHVQAYLCLRLARHQRTDIDIQRDLTWDMKTYCGSLLRHNGLNIVGTSIGTPDYVSGHLHDFTLAFTHTARPLQLVQSPVSRSHLCLTFIQQKVPN